MATTKKGRQLFSGKKCTHRENPVVTSEAVVEEVRSRLALLIGITPVDC